RIKQLEQQVADLQRGAPLRSAGIRMSPDGLTVNSSLDVQGDLSATGDSEVSGPNGLIWRDKEGRVRVRAGRGLSQSGSGAELNGIWYLDESGANRLQLGEIESVEDESTRHGLLVQAANGDDILSATDGRLSVRGDQHAWIEAVADVRISAGGIFSLRTRGGSSNEWGVNGHSGSNGDMFHAIADEGFSLRTPSNSHRIHAVGDDVGVDAPNRLYVAANVHATGDLSCGGTKPFIIDHPIKGDKSLVHVATESDKAVIEYHYRVTIGDDGSTTINLPDYFEALTAPDSRGVQVTPVGRPFMVGAEEPADGQVVVYGDPGREVFVRVNARRGDDAGQFEVEIPRIQPPDYTEEGQP